MCRSCEKTNPAETERGQYAITNLAGMQNIARHDRHHGVGRGKESGKEIHDHTGEDDRTLEYEAHTLAHGAQVHPAGFFQILGNFANREQRQDDSQERDGIKEIGVSLSEGGDHHPAQ
jgi:hypothetical protein